MMADELSWKCRSCGLDLGTGTVAGVIFTAYGNYCSRIYDPCWMRNNPPERLRLVICDSCMVRRTVLGPVIRLEKRIVDAREHWEAEVWQPNATFDTMEELIDDLHKPDAEPPPPKPDDNTVHTVVTAWGPGPTDTNIGPGTYMHHSERCPVCGGKGELRIPYGRCSTCHGCNGRGWVVVPN